MGDFIVTCKNRDALLDILRGRLHFVFTKELFSLVDLVEAKEGALLPMLAKAALVFERHISKQCLVCFVFIFIFCFFLFENV